MSHTEFETDKLFDPELLNEASDALSRDLEPTPETEIQELVFEADSNSLLTEKTNFPDPLKLESLKREVNIPLAKVPKEESSVSRELQKILNRPENQPGYDFQELKFEELKDPLSVSNLFKKENDTFEKEFNQIEAIESKQTYNPLDFIASSMPKATAFEPANDIIKADFDRSWSTAKISGVAASILIAAGYVATTIGSMFGQYKQANSHHDKHLLTAENAVHASEIPGVENEKSNGPEPSPDAESDLEHATAVAENSIQSNADNNGLFNQTPQLLETSKPLSRKEQFEQNLAALPNEMREKVEALNKKIVDLEKSGDLSALLALRKDINRVSKLSTISNERKILNDIKYELRRKCKIGVEKIEYKIIDHFKPKYPNINKSRYDSAVEKISNSIEALKYSGDFPSKLGGSIYRYLKFYTKDKYTTMPISTSGKIITDENELKETLLGTIRRSDTKAQADLLNGLKESQHLCQIFRAYVPNSGLSKNQKHQLNEKLSIMEQRLDKAVDVFVDVAKMGLQGKVLGEKSVYVVHHHDGYASSGEKLKRDHRLQDHITYELAKNPDGFSYKIIKDPTPSEFFRHLEKIDMELQQIKLAGLEIPKQFALTIHNHGNTTTKGDHIIFLKDEVLPYGETGLYGYTKASPYNMKREMSDKDPVSNRILSLKLVTNKINGLLKKHPEIESFKTFVMTCRSKVNFEHNKLKREQLHDNQSVIFLAGPKLEHYTQWVPQYKNYGVSQGLMALYLSKKVNPKNDPLFYKRLDELSEALAVDKGLTNQLAHKLSEKSYQGKKYEVQSKNHTNTLGFNGKVFSNILPKLNTLAKKAFGD